MPPFASLTEYLTTATAPKNRRYTFPQFRPAKGRSACLDRRCCKRQGAYPRYGARKEILNRVLRGCETVCDVPFPRKPAGNHDENAKRPQDGPRSATR